MAGSLLLAQDSHSPARTSSGSGGTDEIVFPHTEVADRIPTMLGLRGNKGQGPELQIKDIWHQAASCEMGPGQGATNHRYRGFLSQAKVSSEILSSHEEGRTLFQTLSNKQSCFKRGLPFI